MSEHRRAGFTLIETVIYIGIFSLLMVFVVSTFFQLTQSSAQSKSRIEVEEEANFIMKKLRWALAGAQTIHTPALNTTSSVLSLDKFNAPDNPLVFSLSSGTIALSRSGGAAAPLESRKVEIRSLIFTYDISTSTPTSSQYGAVTVMLEVVSLLEEGAIRASTTIQSTIAVKK